MAHEVTADVLVRIYCEPGFGLLKAQGFTLGFPEDKIAQGPGYRFRVLACL